MPSISIAGLTSADAGGEHDVAAAFPRSPLFLIHKYVHVSWFVIRCVGAALRCQSVRRRGFGGGCRGGRDDAHGDAREARSARGSRHHPLHKQGKHVAVARLARSGHTDPRHDELLERWRVIL